MDDLGTLEVRWVQGFGGQNVHFVDKKTICYSSGNFVVFADLDTNRRRILQGPGRGIGVLAASASCRVLAFSESRLDPSILVYSYPSLALRSQLRGMAKLDYSCLTLSASGPYLACCSSIPDLTLSLWNWESEVIICRKALDTGEVTSLTFNPLNWQQLCAFGVTSITVWNVEKCENLQAIKSSVIKLPVLESPAKKSTATFSQGSDGNFSYLGPQMPVSTIAGLVGEEATGFVSEKEDKGRLCAGALCWTVSSELYVGCEEGHLLQVNLDTQSVSILYDPRTAVKPAPLLSPGSLCSLALSRDTLFTAGKDGVLRCLHIKSAKVEVKKLWEVGEPIVGLVFSPDSDTLLVSSHHGHVYRYRPLHPEKMMRVLDVPPGQFVAAVPLAIDNSFCVSVQDNGELRLWSMDTGFCVRSLSLSVQATSLASCPSALYVAVGTSTGHIIFVDLTQKLQPRVIHRSRLHQVAIEHLTFDQGGNFLLAGASDSHLFILDPRPSKMFQIIGFTEECSPVLGISTHHTQNSPQVRVLLLCSEQEGSLKEGRHLVAYDLPVQELTGGQSCADPQGRLADSILQKQRFEVPQPLSSATLGPNSSIFSYCNRSKTLQRFKLPEITGPSNPDEVIQLNPLLEVDSHLLGPAFVLLSPHQCWLASVGKDGELRLCDTSGMERHLQVQCHSCSLGGARTVSFTVDSRSLVIIGSRDKSLVCVWLRMKPAGAGEANAATQYGQSLISALKPSLVMENPILSRMPVWDPKASVSRSSLTPHRDKGSARRCSVELMEKVDGVEDHSDSSLTSRAEQTWLEHKWEEVLQEEKLKFSEERKSLQKATRELRNTIQAMMRENEMLPDIEKLEHLDFNLNEEEQMRLQAKGEEEVARVRNEIELENLAKSYLCEVLKRDCWDSMNIKGQAIKAFHSDHEVMNYPMRERTQKELEDLQRVQRIRKIEQTDRSIQLSFLEKMSKAVNEKEEEPEDKGDSESPALAGSLSAQFGGHSPYLYSQFELYIRDQKVNQIILLQDIIYQVKTDFNTRFASVFKQKEQEIIRVKERNKRMAEIMAELDLKGELWVPSLTDSERPERALVVEDSEIKVEKYLSPEERLKEEALKKAEEQRRLAAKGDNLRERALDDMMGGVLEVKKEEILKMEIPQPEFMSKPEVQWTEEEKKNFKVFEKKVKELSEEQEKYRKALEAEMKKLQISMKEATQGFDQVLMKLFQRKVKTEMVIYQEELKIVNLVNSVLIEEEILNREMELSNKLQKARILKHELGEEVRKCKDNVEAFRETYDIVIAEDKLLDKGFKKEFPDVPAHLVDQLYKLYKRRPWVQRMRMQSGRAAGEGRDQLKKAIEELDAPENMPEGLDSAVWERFCQARRTKVDSEQKVKQKALTLAEMQAFLQRRMDEDERAKLEVKNIMEELRILNEEKMKFRLNIMVQILIKQGQVEVEKGDFITDLSDSLLIHRKVVEDLNGTIKALGEQKIARMVECKDYRKGIIQMEWEHCRLAMLKEDLQNKARDIQKLRVSQEQQEYLSEADHKTRTTKQLSTMEKNITLQEKIHQKNVSKAKAEIQKLNQQAEQWAAKSDTLDSQLTAMNIAVAEVKNIYEAAAEDTQESSIDHRYQEILQRKRLTMLSQAQNQKLSCLRAEVERLRMKNFPALVDPDK